MSDDAQRKTDAWSWTRTRLQRTLLEGDRDAQQAWLDAWASQIVNLETEQIEISALLSEAGIPREQDGRTLGLRERVEALSGVWREQVVMRPADPQVLYRHAGNGHLYRRLEESDVRQPGFALVKGADGRWERSSTGALLRVSGFVYYVPADGEPVAEGADLYATTAERWVRRFRPVVHRGDPLAAEE